MQHLLLVILSSLFFSCEQEEQTNSLEENNANVIQVSISGSESNYNFSVTISSPDTGCDQYADWWEIVSESGELIYRRILAHSHVSEQPFTRSGATISIAKDQIVWIRAHMNTTGYGGDSMKGSVDAGFQKVKMVENFAADLDQASPLPNGCAF